MLAELKSISEAIQSLITLIGTVGFIYILLMGLSFRKGRNAWLAGDKARRAKANGPDLKYLSKEKETPLFWKDEALIQGGMVALGTILVLLMYIVFMLLILPTPKDQVVPRIAALFSYPNSMIGYLTFQVLLTRAVKEKSWDPIKESWWLLSITLGVAIGTFWLISTGSNPVKTLIIQIILLGLQSTLLAYLFGMFKGQQEADPAFPTVRIFLSGGGVVEGLRFHRGTDLDYRFFNAEGEERIIPCGQIGSIEYCRDSAAK